MYKFEDLERHDPTRPADFLCFGDPTRPDPRMDPTRSQLCVLVDGYQLTKFQLPSFNRF